MTDIKEPFVSQDHDWIQVKNPIDEVKLLSGISLIFILLFLILLLLGWDKFSWQGGHLKVDSVYGFWAFSLIFPMVFFSFVSILGYLIKVRYIAIEEERLFVKYSWNRKENYPWTAFQSLNVNVWKAEILDSSGIPVKIASTSLKLGHKNSVGFVIDVKNAERIKSIYERTTGIKAAGSLVKPEPPVQER